jgi:hypothetical protein
MRTALDLSEEIESAVSAVLASPRMRVDGGFARGAPTVHTQAFGWGGYGSSPWWRSTSGRAW